MHLQRILWLSEICLAGCLAVGCTPALSTQRSQAVYPGGVSFFAQGSGPYSSLQWQADNANKPQPCPLVLHLPGGDFTAQDLADAKKLQACGWRETFQDNASATIEYTWQEMDKGAERSLAQVRLTSGVPSRVLLRTTEDVSASIDGKRLSLPIGPRSLEELLGKPLRVEVTDV